MIGYIYSIINNTTGKRYVGITLDINRRLRKHKNELNNQTHHSPKLQNAWNYYGKKDFTYTYKEVEILEYNELYELEIEEIKKYDSYNNGYNCNSGGKIADWKQKVKDEDIVGFLCVQKYYGTGYGKTFEQIFNWAKGTASAALRKIRFTNANCEFERLNEEEIKEKAIYYMQTYKLDKIKLERQMKQGGCSKAYNLTLEDYFFAFAAQEIGYSYTPVALYLEIKPNTVKDWFNGRTRKKEKALYDNLSLEEKERLIGRVKIAELSGKPKSK